ncbi:hypothetical protein BJ878DRAFT_546804 [Calycina marina]|uniref:Uncharacterized protein n=1 Tax=Calycina marina TaxID=1763456 RepID=A0A9P7YTY1_9HELO|nr:hypothetical protein BJ878DRAFT_546804 [Calycina marina]
MEGNALDGDTKPSENRKNSLRVDDKLQTRPFDGKEPPGYIRNDSPRGPALAETRFSGTMTPDEKQAVENIVDKPKKDASLARANTVGQIHALQATLTKPGPLIALPFKVATGYKLLRKSTSLDRMGKFELEKDNLKDKLAEAREKAGKTQRKLDIWCSMKKYSNSLPPKGRSDNHWCNLNEDAFRAARKVEKLEKELQGLRAHLGADEWKDMSLKEKNLRDVENIQNSEEKCSEL